MKLVYQYMAIFFNFPPTSSHLHPLQVENCDSNSRLVVDEDDNDKFRPERVNHYSATWSHENCRPPQHVEAMINLGLKGLTITALHEAMKIVALLNMLKLYLAAATHSIKWVKISWICFQFTILLILQPSDINHLFLFKKHEEKDNYQDCLLT